MTLLGASVNQSASVLLRLPAVRLPPLSYISCCVHKMCADGNKQLRPSTVLERTWTLMNTHVGQVCHSIWSLARYDMWLLLGASFV